jgi:polyisoprenyl-phosphate glycosyltransferase
MTGRSIDFGNFCLIPWTQLGRVVHMPETWNHLAGAIVKSRCPIIRVETKREARYEGSSKMNIVALVVHGLSAIAVFGDTVFVRALLTSLALSALAALGGIVIVAVRLFTDLAIPGWASTLGALTLVILFQALSLSAGAAFMILNSRANLTGIPALDARRFVQSRVVVHQLCQPNSSNTLAVS